MNQNKIRKNYRKSTVRISNNRYKILLWIHLIEKKFSDELYTLEDLSKRFKLPSSTLHDNLSGLKQQGLIACPCKGVYRLTPNGRKIVSRLIEGIDFVERKFRAHHVQIVYPLFYPPKNIDALHQLCSPVTNRKFKRHDHKIEGATFMIYGKKIHASIKVYYEDEIDDFFGIVQRDYVFPMGKYLETTFDLKIDYENVKVKPQHLALLDHPIAKLLVENGINFMSSILHADASTGPPEIETVDSKRSFDHMEKLIRLLKNWENELSLDDIEKPKFRWGDSWKR